MNVEKVPKAFASFRLLHEVKQALENEAAEKELSFSKYIEELIAARHESREISALERLDFQDRIDELEVENDSLKEELEITQSETSDYEPDLQYTESVETENLELSAELQELSDISVTNSALDMSEEEQALFSESISKLSEVHPNVPVTQLLLGALDTTLRTESAFWAVPTINKFLNQNRLS